MADIPTCRKYNLGANPDGVVMQLLDEDNKVVAITAWLRDEALAFSAKISDLAKMVPVKDEPAKKPN